MADWEEGGTKVLAGGVGQGAQSCSYVWSWGPRIDLGMYGDSDKFMSEHHLRCVWNMFSKSLCIHVRSWRCQCESLLLPTP